MKISQREAQRLRKQVYGLLRQINRMKSTWSSDYAEGWVNIENLTLSAESFARLRTARSLGYAVVAVTGANNAVHFYADRV